MQYISQLSCQHVELPLSECFIDDIVLLRSKQAFLECTNIVKLNLSGNDFTLQGFGILMDFVQQE